MLVRRIMLIDQKAVGKVEADATQRIVLARRLENVNAACGSPVAAGIRRSISPPHFRPNGIYLLSRIIRFNCGFRYDTTIDSNYDKARVIHIQVCRVYYSNERKSS